jgi:two-component sensor histidine kinase
MTFLPAIMLAGLFGGIQVGLGVAFASLLVAWVLFFPPYGTFTLESHDLITMVIFIVTAALEIYVIRALNLNLEELALERERSQTLFRELQHRVANNLTFVAALLKLRKNTLEPGSAGASALDAAFGRISLLAKVHRRLHDPDIINLPVETFLGDLCRDLIAASDTPNIHFAIETRSIELELNTLISVALITAELITNSLKHAFKKEGTDGTIAVALERSGRHYMLTVADNGCGLPLAFSQSKAKSLGQDIIRSLASQLSGEISVEAGQSGQGTTARLTFPA